MKLYFLRHGEAEEGVDMPDAERRLTPRGIERVTQAARIMRRLDIAPLYIYSSPRVRAWQTADIVAQALGMAVDIREEVNFSFNVDAVRQLISGLGEEESVMFVGHNPSMSTVVHDLTGAALSLKKGGLARVDLHSLNPLRAELVWLVAPKVFDSLNDDDAG